MRLIEFLKDKRNLTYCVFLSMIVSIILAVEELLDDQYTELSDIGIELVSRLPIYVLLTFLVSYISSLIIQWLNRILPWEEKGDIRLWTEVMIALGLMATYVVITLVIAQTFEVTTGGSEFIVISMLMFFITISLTFVFHEFLIVNERKNKISLFAKELEEQHLKTKYEALKNQVNPHFLFNSLNVLSTLIYKDIKIADQFIRQFSDVFRYVLELNTDELVPLKKELKFVDSYIFLQKTRYGKLLKVSKKITSDQLELMVPPMSLQVVVENALKHNVISEAAPLWIAIFTDGDSLVISNNYQLRKNGAISTGLGQKNLLERYRLNGKRLPRFYLEDNFYYAELPLLEN